MALKRRKNSPYWFYSFTFAGKRYRGSTGERSKAAAAAVEAAALIALNQGQELARSTKKPTVREFSARYTTWLENNLALADATRKYYRYGIRLLLLPKLADVPMDRLTAEMIECTKFVSPVYDRKAGKVTSELVSCSKSYSNQALRTLKVLFGKAVEWTVLSSKPHVRSFKTEGRDQLIDHDTEIKLQTELEMPTEHGRHSRLRKQSWIFMVIPQDAGMRPDEVFRMRFEQLDFARERIWVPRGKTKTPGALSA